MIYNTKDLLAPLATKTIMVPVQWPPGSAENPIVFRAILSRECGGLGLDLAESVYPGIPAGMTWEEEQQLAIDLFANLAEMAGERVWRCRPSVIYDFIGRPEKAPW